MRLFTAIEIPAEMLMRVERLTSALRGEALVKWSPNVYLHITTKFIGEWPEPRLPDLNDVLSGLFRRQRFEIELKGLGWYPSETSPRVLWLGVDGGEPLQALAKEMEERLLAIGVQKEERAYSPHLTLARMKDPVPLRRLREKVEEMQPAAMGSFSAGAFSLFRSLPGSNASIYQKLYEYQFASAQAAP